MSLADLRDLFIVIFSIIGIVATVLLVVLSFLVFRRIRSMLDSGRETVANISKISAAVSDSIVKPLSRIAGFLRGFRHAMDYVGRVSRRKEGKSHERGE
jgi:hypothetical protein